MGIGSALHEEMVIDNTGKVRNPSFLDYHLVTSLDCPELIPIIVECAEPEGPYGAKEAGEGPLHPSIPAIANAIHDALGIRCDRLPFSPPRVLGLLTSADARAGWDRARASFVGARAGAGVGR